MIKRSYVTGLLTSMLVACAGGDEDVDQAEDEKADASALMLKADKPVMLSGAAGDPVLFKFTVPKDPDYSRIRFRMENAAGDADLLVSFGEKPEEVLVEGDPFIRADFKDNDTDSTVSSQDCFFQICSGIQDGFVDPVVRADFLELQPGTYFGEVRNGDGYAQEIDEGLAKEPIRPEFRDKFEALLVVQTRTGTKLAGQSIDVKIGQPFEYFADSWDHHAIFDIKVPPGHQTLRLKVEDPTKDNWGRTGRVFARSDRAYTAADVSITGLAKGYEFGMVEEDQIDIPVAAGGGTWHFILIAGSNAVFNELTATLDP